MSSKLGKMSKTRNFITMLLILLSGLTQLYAHSNKFSVDLSIQKIFEIPAALNENCLHKSCDFHLKSIPAFSEKENHNEISLKFDEDEDKQTFTGKKQLAVSKLSLSVFLPEINGDSYRKLKKRLPLCKHTSYYNSGRNLFFCVLRI